MPTPHRARPLTARLPAAAGCLLTALLLAAPSAPLWAAPGAPLLSYGVDLSSSYVDRGTDLFTGVYDAEGKEHEAFNPAPVLQPSLTFHGPEGLSFGLWGSFALTNRDPADGDLASLDEIDYTLSWDWENKLGSFSVGVGNYANVPARGAASEVLFTWGLPFAESLAPTFAHYSDTASAATYTSLGFGGGETLSWGLTIGYGQSARETTLTADTATGEVSESSSRSEGGIQDVTLNLSYAVSDALSVAFNAAYRPTPDLVGYDKDGKYKVGNEEKKYPPVIFWLTLSYGAEITE